MQSLAAATGVRRHRELAGLTQQVLATRAGIALRTLNRIESGEDCTVRTLSAIAAALGISVSDLLVPSEEPAR